MKPLILSIPKPERSAKQFLLTLAPYALHLFDVPQKILGFNVENIVRQQVYAMSEETAKKKLDALKGMLNDW